MATKHSKDVCPAMGTNKYSELNNIPMLRTGQKFPNKGISKWLKPKPQESDNQHREKK